MIVKKTLGIFAYVSDGQVLSWMFYDGNLVQPFVKAGEVEVTAEIPDDFDFRTPAVDALRKEQQELRAEVQGKINLIEEQIGKLLCLEAPEGPALDANAGMDDWRGL